MSDKPSLVSTFTNSCGMQTLSGRCFKSYKNHLFIELKVNSQVFTDL